MTALYTQALAALELSGLGHLARHSAWTFTIANVLHVLGSSLLVGAIAVFDGSLLARRFDDAARIGRFAIPIAAGGLLLQVPTGLVLLAAEARALGINPAFLAKLAFIALGLLNVALFHLLLGRDLRAGRLNPRARSLAIVSLAAWIGALAAGRMIAYL
ncbi:MAG TPA: DUF2214 domain-containing protein [Microvirga sp.]|jgi:hypothetical protein